MERSIEDILRNEGYKSEGERKIAAFFQEAGMHFVYEKPILVEDKGKQRIWYPDFWLPDYSIIIEYFGVLGEEAYDLAIKHKMDVYAQNHLNVIPVYPQTFETDWQDYVLRSIRKNLVKRLINFEETDRQYQRRVDFPHSQEIDSELK